MSRSGVVVPIAVVTTLLPRSGEDANWSFQTWSVVWTCPLSTAPCRPLCVAGRQGRKESQGPVDRPSERPSEHSADDAHNGKVVQSAHCSVSRIRWGSSVGAPFECSCAMLFRSCAMLFRSRAMLLGSCAMLLGTCAMCFGQDTCCAALVPYSELT